jgi:ATP-dependent helicase YprA (DUF1998 family)
VSLLLGRVRQVVEACGGRRETLQHALLSATLPDPAPLLAAFAAISPGDDRAVHVSESGAREHGKTLVVLPTAEAGGGGHGHPQQDAVVKRLCPILKRLQLTTVVFVDMVWRVQVRSCSLLCFFF